MNQCTPLSQALLLSGEQREQQTLNDDAMSQSMTRSVPDRPITVGVVAKEVVLRAYPHLWDKPLCFIGTSIGLLAMQ
ncbi:hypothetical protein GOODEAATRI_007938, partial [Goodea atripinnis]